MKSVKELRKICQNPQDCHNFNSYFHNKIWRVFSIYITKILLYTPLKPDHITMLMVFWGFIVGFFFSIGTYWYTVTGAIFLEFFLVLDCVDGELARYKKISSLNGIFLDLVAHLINLSIPFIGLTLGLYKVNPKVCIFLVGISASVFSILYLNIQPIKYYVFFREFLSCFKGTKKINSKKIFKKVIEKQSRGNILKRIGKKVSYLYDGVYIIQIIFLASIFNKTTWVIFFYGLTFPIMCLLKLIHEYKAGYKPYEHLIGLYKK